jgi:phosphohistidine swiveling domain-containing protein
MTDWLLQWEAPPRALYWHMGFIHKIYDNELLANLVGFQEQHMLADCSTRGYSFYLSAQEMPSLQSQYRVWHERGGAEKYLSHLPQLADEVGRVSLSETGVTPPTSESFAYLENLFHRSVAAHIVTQPHLTEALTSRLRTYFESTGRSPADLREITMPTALPEVLQEQLEWLQIVESQPSVATLDLAIDEHLRRWRYITAGDSHGPLTQSALLERYQRDLSDQPAVRRILAELSQVKSGTRAQHLRQTMKRLALPEHMEKLATDLGRLSLIRFHTKSLCMKLTYRLEHLLQHWSKECGFDLASLDSDEFVPSWPDVLPAPGRDTYLYRRDETGSYLYWNGRDSTEREIELPDRNFSEIEILTGDSAYPGHATGRALVIDWNDDIRMKGQLVTPETILVVPQTTPAFASALAIARGLVVDEGGLTGHASIVAREYQIPSVIGTRIGTRVFQDGDLIEIRDSAVHLRRRGDHHA